MFVTAISERRASQEVGAAADRLATPADAGKPIPANYVVPAAGTVNCEGIGQTGLATNLTMGYGADGQPYFGGQPGMNTFLGTPGGKQRGAWPQCVMGGDAVAASTTSQQLHDQLAAQFL